MITEQRSFLEKAGITFSAKNHEVHFGFGSPSQIHMECPCELRAGKYDVQSIGAYTYLGGGDTVARHIGRIGRFTQIAANFFAGPMEHRVEAFCSHPIFEGRWKNKWPEVDRYYGENASRVCEALSEYEEDLTSLGRIEIGNSVWVGEGVFVKRGVRIGDGAIVASRSVVVDDVPPFSIVAGVPAKVKRHRFPKKIIQGFLDVKWWDYGLDSLQGIQLTSLSVKDAERLLDDIRNNIERRSLRTMSPAVAVVEKDGSCKLKE